MGVSLHPLGIQLALEILRNARRENTYIFAISTYFILAQTDVRWVSLGIRELKISCSNLQRLGHRFMTEQEILQEETPGNNHERS